ncbi:MAG: hypothetical protein EB047_08620, partial [Chitinophagaceae bacterium]|nr:hypothetical protein [Chitinophagaceae bacterium]
AQATLKDRKHHIFIMNELDFLPLEKEKQEKISEYRIKKFLEKKNFLFESDSLRWFKRRATKDRMLALQLEIDKLERVLKSREKNS